MNKASPVAMRKALAMVDALKMAGILFVAIPVLDEDDHKALLAQVTDKLNKIEMSFEDA